MPSYDTQFIPKVTNLIASWAQAVNDKIWKGRNPLYVTSTGSANAYTITLPATSLYTALVAGDTFTWKANFTNTGAATLQIVGGASLGPTALKMRAGAALPASTITTGDIITCIYDGTNFQLAAVVPAATVIGITTGSANVYAVTIPNATTTSGQVIYISPNFSNTAGAPTLSLNGGTALPVVNFSYAVLIAGELRINSLYILLCTGGNWIILNGLDQTLSYVFAGQNTFTGQTKVIGSYAGEGQLLLEHMPNVTGNSTALTVTDFNTATTGQTVAAQLNSFSMSAGMAAWGIATEAWSGTHTLEPASGGTLQNEVGVISQAHANASAVVGLNVTFKDRSDALVAGNVLHGSVGTNYYNANTRAIQIDAQAASTSGERCGWGVGIQFQPNALDKFYSVDAIPPGVTKPTGISFNRISQTANGAGNVPAADASAMSFSTNATTPANAMAIPIASRALGALLGSFRINVDGQDVYVPYYA